MARMTRTQISLEQDEYRYLKARAAEQGSSLSAVIRALVRDSMGQALADRPHVTELAGLITESDFSGRDHDRILYVAAGTTAAAESKCDADGRSDQRELRPPV